MPDLAKLAIVLAAISPTLAAAETTASRYPGEVIEIHDSPPPLPSQLSVKPKPLTDPDILAPYSDEAIERDVWTRAWLLLDIDSAGNVTRVKFLKRPGAGLDSIAMERAFATRFTPARDLANHASRAYVVWKIEWPSWQWMIDRVGVVTRMPRLGLWAHLLRGAVTPRAVPCRGSGPLNLDSVHPVYRDCSVPDPKRLDPRERWIARAQ